MLREVVALEPSKEAADPRFKNISQDRGRKLSRPVVEVHPIVQTTRETAEMPIIQEPLNQVRGKTVLLGVGEVVQRRLEARPQQTGRQIRPIFRLEQALKDLEAKQVVILGTH
jgi:hypothetical protein